MFSRFVLRSAFMAPLMSLAFAPGALRSLSRPQWRQLAAMPTDEEGWRVILSPMQFAVLREKGTEPPGYSERTPGELEYELKEKHGTKYPDSGAYECAACSAPLYYARTKFNSGEFAEAFSVRSKQWCSHAILLFSLWMAGIFRRHSRGDQRYACCLDAATTSLTAAAHAARSCNL
eukprot:scaffold1340_cov253-Pinguiococcus_pyrenoidosus.AAC.43